MKKVNWSILSLFIIGMTFLNACTSSNDESSPLYNGVAVTVAGTDFTGYKLYTDFDVILNPTNIAQLPALKKVNRAIISFALSDESKALTDLEAGKTYDIVLDVENCMSMPTFTGNIDTASNEYIANGQDSIAKKNQKIQAINRGENSFYAKNGYLNTVAQFAFANKIPVRFALYYDGTKDIDTENREITFHLYYNSGTNNPFETIASPLSFKISSNIYDRFIEAGIGHGEKIDIYLKAATTETGTNTLHTEAELKDFLQP